MTVQPQDTQFRRVEQFRDRWSLYGSDTGLLELSEKLSVEELRRIDVFDGYRDAFLETISPDVSVATWDAGAVLFEEGSYIDLAFIVLEGELALYLASQQTGSTPGPIFDQRHATLLAEAGTMGTMDGRTRLVDAPAPQAAPAAAAPAEKTDGERDSVLLATMDFDLPEGAHVRRMGPGDIFGEIGALNGWPQSVTARALTTCRVVQVRRPALRQMKRQSAAFKDRVDALYRERSLTGQLSACPLFAGCSDAALEALASRAELVSCEPDEVVESEGQAIDSLYLVRSGFMKLTQRLGGGEAVVSYLSKGMTFGEIELMLPERRGAAFTLSAVGYGELVRLAQDDVRALMRQHPEIEPLLWTYVVARIKDTGAGRASPRRSEMIEFALQEGLVQGNSILVIDLNDCTRCDDCVRACASTHDGRARFVREGDRYGNLLIARSCYHCEDPVCLIGCPTGAIRRANVGDVVEIRDSICIGCGTCSNNCPYGAIVAHDTGTLWPDNALPRSLRGTPRHVASKCDLCYTSDAGPACVRGCPQGCATRIGSIDEFRRLVAGAEGEADGEAGR